MFSLDGDNYQTSRETTLVLSLFIFSTDSTHITLSLFGKTIVSPLRELAWRSETTGRFTRLSIVLLTWRDYFGQLECYGVLRLERRTAALPNYHAAQL